MTARLDALCMAAHDVRGLATFWSGLLGGPVTDEGCGGVAVRPDDDLGFRIRFRPSLEPKVGPNQMHVDLTSSSPSDQHLTVARALDLGARQIDVGQLPEEGHVVLADPEGNEFCVIEPGNAFLADCGFVGALSCDGTQQVGYFWSAALGWPLVWDQDQETAIRAPHGGPKITWGGPPLNPKTGPNRLRFDLAPARGSSPVAEVEAEVERLLALGATRVDLGPLEPGLVMLADPDGNEFSVLAP